MSASFANMGFGSAGGPEQRQGAARPMTVVLVGPSDEHVGGMAAVVRQIRDMDFAGRYRVQFVPMTFASTPMHGSNGRAASAVPQASTRSLPFGFPISGRRESLPDRLVRHWRHRRHLQSVIRTTKASIVHLHTCSGATFFRSVVDLLAARRPGAKVICHVHGAAFDEFFASAGPLVRGLIRWSLIRADCVCALSAQWRKKLLAMAPRARVAVIENAVEVMPRSAAFPQNPPAVRCRFLMLARMDAWKGVDDLLDACARLHAEDVGFELTLAGPEGSAGDAATLRTKIAQRGLESSVEYVGAVQGERKESLLRRADVYVQASHHEGMPMAVLEAMAHAVPVVATTVGALPEVVDDGRDGLLVPPKRPDLLAGAMKRFASDPALRAEMSRAAWQKAQTRFSLKRLRGDLLALYDSVAMERQPATAETSFLAEPATAG